MGRYARPLKDRLPPARAEKGHISSIMNGQGQDAIAPICEFRGGAKCKHHRTIE